MRSKPFAFVLVVLSLFFISMSSFADSSDFGYKPMRNKLRYKEDFFRLYTGWLYADLDSISRNIYFLELAYALPFDHPIKAMVPITNKMQYTKYQDLIMTHICTLLTKEYINYGYMHMKEKIYFFNEEFFTNYLEGFEIAETYFKSAEDYWKLAIKHAKRADKLRRVPLNLNFNGWKFDFEDEVHKIKTGQIKYFKAINHLRQRIARNRKEIADYRKQKQGG